MIRNICHCEYKDIISLENLLTAWREFVRGKRKRKDVELFEINLMHNLRNLHDDLEKKIYRHGGYEAFKVTDPKPRDIHKASVRDRLVHHAIYRKLYHYFDKIFISDSYSCRLDKGTHKAMRRFNNFYLKVSKNNTRQVWVLKCDIRKFFASIDQEILFKILDEHILDRDIFCLLGYIIVSFHTRQIDKGLPLGNLTSQLFVNVYMNEFDQFVKHKLKAKHYIRYSDDFVILSDNKGWLRDILPKINVFLDKELKLSLHPNKVSIKTFSSGVDFLGWVNFPNYRVLRTTTKKKMFRRIAESQKKETLTSYLGMLSHGNTNKIKNQILSMIG